MRPIHRALLLVVVFGWISCAAETPPPTALHRGAPLPAGRGTYRVLLPPLEPGRSYPVLYFLHDYFGDSGILWRQGVAAELHRRMESGALPPLVVVAPDGNHGYWSDFHDGSRRYESWVAEGLRAEVEARFPVSRERAHRAVSGISMGGFGAVKLGLRRPDLYESASSLSGALLPLDWSFIAEQGWFSRRRLTRIFGHHPDANNADDNDPRRLLAARRGESTPALYLRSGSEDKYNLDQAATKFAERARQQGLTVELVLERGGHTWSYWRNSALAVVDWHARRFAAAIESETERGGEP